MMFSKIGRVMLGSGLVTTILFSAPAYAVLMTVLPSTALGVEQAEGDSSPLGGDPLAWTFQMVYGTSLLSGLQAGDIITGMTFRLDVTSRDGNETAGNNTNMPAQTVANYVIKMGQSANAPGALSATFASNYSGAATTVRSGSFAIGAGDFTGGSTAPTPNSFGSMIDFTVSSYTYAGGPLLIEISHDGFTGPYVPDESVPGRFVDDTAETYAGIAQEIFATGYNSLVADTFEDQAMVIQLRYTRPGGPGPEADPDPSVPEPSAASLFGAGLACLMGVTIAGRRRRMALARIPR